VVLDHRVCEQLFAHRLDVILGLGGVRAFEFDLEHLALPDRSDAGEIKRRKRAFNRLSLWVENAVLQRDGNACLDHGYFLELSEPAPCRAWRKPEPDRMGAAVRFHS